MKKSSHYLLRIVATTAAALLPDCAGHAANGPAVSDGSRPIRVVAIERAYGDIAEQIGGAGVAVTTILNSPTADPHDYEPTTHDADAIASADIVIENGLGYDAFADKLLGASPSTGRDTLVVGTLGGHTLGNNPHVWYETKTLHAFATRFAAALDGRLAGRERTAIETATRKFQTWVDGLSAHEAETAKRFAGTPVAITEPVFNAVLDAAKLKIATPLAFSHAIEEGNDPAPQDVAAMQALLSGRNVAAFAYNSQTVEPSTSRLLAVANAAHVPVVPVTETLPAGTHVQAWIDGELRALDAALASSKR